MASFFKANAVIQGGTINNTAIDLQNNHRIRNIQDPIDNQDAVTLKTLNNNITAATVVTTVTLSGTSKVTISLRTSGVFTVYVTNRVPHGPNAIFHVLKSDASRHSMTVAMAACLGQNTHERLYVSWPPNEGIQLFKNGAQYDGDYIVKIIVGDNSLFA